jgi:hypothetical protein
VSLISTKEDDVGADDRRLQTLRARIRWICQILRFGAPIAVVWGFINDIVQFSDATTLSKQVAFLFGENFVPPIADWQRLALFASTLPCRLALFALAYNAWLLFSGYLAGRIFTIDAARLLQRCGVFGAIAVILDILTRPLVVPILAGTRSADAHPAVPELPFFGPGDLHFLIFYVALIGLGHIQKTAAEIYAENAQIV